jgi:hypothetical protein
MGRTYSGKIAFKNTLLTGRMPTRQYPGWRLTCPLLVLCSSPCLLISNVLSVERHIPGTLYRMSVKNAGGHYSRVTGLLRSRQRV